MGAEPTCSAPQTTAKTSQFETFAMPLIGAFYTINSGHRKSDASGAESRVLIPADCMYISLGSPSTQMVRQTWGIPTEGGRHGSTGSPKDCRRAPVFCRT